MPPGGKIPPDPSVIDPALTRAVPTVTRSFTVIGPLLPNQVMTESFLSTLALVPSAATDPVRTFARSDRVITVEERRTGVTRTNCCPSAAPPPLSVAVQVTTVSPGGKAAGALLVTRTVSPKHTSTAPGVARVGAEQPEIVEPTVSTG